MIRIPRLCAIALAFLTGFVAVTARAADETRLLEVVVNGYSTNKIGEFVLRAGELFAKPSELRSLGLKVSDDAPIPPDGLVALSSLSGVSEKLDEPTQTLYVTAQTEALIPAILKTEDNEGGRDDVEHGTGATMNYDISGNFVSGKAVGTGAYSLRGFSPLGLLSTNLLSYMRTPSRGLKSAGLIRLDSTYVFSDPGRLQRLYAGDTLTGGLSWSRPVRLGGIRFASDFSLEPNFISFPVPSLAGTAATPSTLDVLVNGASVLSQPVQPGPFQIPHVPVPTGAGSIGIRLSDAAGLLAVSTLPYYASTDLLADGLQSYSIEFGKLRENYGLASNEYGDFAGSATYRRGLSSRFTFETHGEATSRIFMAGLGGIATVVDFCAVNASASASGGETAGSQISFGAEHVGRMLSAGVSATFSTRDFGDLASTMGNPAPARTINLNAGLAFGAYGSVGMSYSVMDYDSRPGALRFSAPADSFTPLSASEPGGEITIANGIASFQQAEHVHVLAANYSIGIGANTLSAAAFHDLAGGSEGIMVSLTIATGDSSSAAAEAGSGTDGRYERVMAVRSPTQIGDWGYNASAIVGDHAEEYGEASYRSPIALVSAGADRLNSATSLHTGIEGAVSYADSAVIASNTIADAFAIVDTDGVENVQVMNENNTIGRTNSSGRLIVTDLRSFDTNHLAIDPTDVPLDASMDSAESDVKPGDHAGVVVHFHIRASHGAIVRLVDRADLPLPVGSVAILKASGKAVPIGFDGDAYVEDIAAGGNELAVERPNGGRCTARFVSRASPGQVPIIGPIVCAEDAP